MSWNEIKLHLAPSGSEVYSGRKQSATTADGYPVSVLTVCPLKTSEAAIVKLENLEKWLVEYGFEAIGTKSRSLRYDLEDVSVLVHSHDGGVMSITLNCKVSASVRARLKVWKHLVIQMCEMYQFKLIDSTAGLVDPKNFQAIVERSFAWECFLKKERSSKR
jgi:hypothetical protein